MSSKHPPSHPRFPSLQNFKIPGSIRVCISKSSPAASDALSTSSITAEGPEIRCCRAEAGAKEAIVGVLFTLWLCQNSYWKWPFIVSFPSKNGGSFHSYLKLPEGKLWNPMKNFHSMAMQQEPIHWRYLPYIRPMFQGIFPQNMARYMVQYLHSRILNDIS